MFCHADECDSDDEDIDVWAADPNLTGTYVFTGYWHKIGVDHKAENVSEIGLGFKAQR